MGDSRIETTCTRDRDRRSRLVMGNTSSGSLGTVCNFTCSPLTSLYAPVAPSNFPVTRSLAMAGANDGKRDRAAPLGGRRRAVLGPAALLYVAPWTAEGHFPLYRAMTVIMDRVIPTVTVLDAALHSGYRGDPRPQLAARLRVPKYSVRQLPRRAAMGRYVLEVSHVSKQEYPGGQRQGGAKFHAGLDSKTHPVFFIISMLFRYIKAPKVIVPSTSTKAVLSSN
ncbi:hypothetical protein F4778DRAFT_60068 [Xylariomycetidae sp. FL2044]|nr:hypothetical protein F4778DRAFT_60068 [Xylariomycetidae sp. FL2044]